MRLKIASNVRFLRLCTKSCIKRCKLDVNQIKKAIRLYEPDGLKCLYLLRFQTLIISQADAWSGEKQENRQIQAKPRKVPIKYGVSFSGFSKSTPFSGKVMPKYRLSLLSKLMSSDVNLFREIVQA